MGFVGLFFICIFVLGHNAMIRGVLDTQLQGCRMFPLDLIWQVSNQWLCRMFVETCQRLRLMKGSEAVNLGTCFHLKPTFMCYNCLLFHSHRYSSGLFFCCSQHQEPPDEAHSTLGTPWLLEGKRKLCCFEELHVRQKCVQLSPTAFGPLVLLS